MACTPCIKVMHMNACDMCEVHMDQVQSNYFTGTLPLFLCCDCFCIPLQQKITEHSFIFGKIAGSKYYSMLKESLKPVSALPIFWKSGKE